MRIGSLFSGIGGLELGLEWAGVGHTVWQVERDAYCQQVLARHWPSAQRFDDVCAVGAHNLPPVDVICGGFPCQDISDAGKRAGIKDGTRSGLWYEYARIVRELRPRYVVVENVRALVLRGLDVVLGELARAGYDAEWEMLSAAAVGAPHLRERVFLVAWRVDRDTHGMPKRAQPSFSQGPHAEPDRIRAPLANADGRWGRPDTPGGHDTDRTNAGREKADSVLGTVCDGGRARTVANPDSEWQPDERRRPADGRWWATEPDVGRVAHGVPARLDRLKALGNAVVPQCAEVIGRRLLAIDAERRAA